MMMSSSNGHRRPTSYQTCKTIIAFSALAVILVFATAVHTVETPPDQSASPDTLREKIDTYKKFKAIYDDKDFQLNNYRVNRTKIIAGEAKSQSFDVYHITYGIIADNIKEYGRRRKQIVYNPTKPPAHIASNCTSGRYLEDYSGSSLHPEITCIDQINHSYAVSLIFETLPEKELETIAVIYEFNDGDLDIQFGLDKGRDKEAIASLFSKLKKADEKYDEKRQAPKMEPIIPTDNQRVSLSYLDEDNDGEMDFVLIPYCINGSYFDEDPANNTIQVALKYKLVTRQDLAGKSPEERMLLARRMGLWMWDKPSEILTSFTDHPGPDIVFYDIGKMENSRIIDPKPDGQFDRYEFLY